MLKWVFIVIKMIRKWSKSTAGKVSIIMFVISVILLLISGSTIESDLMSERSANFVNNILIGISTNLIGIIVTVSFVQFFLDKQDEKEKRIDEIKTIKRYDRYMQTLLRRYFRFYIIVTTRLEDRNAAYKIDYFKHEFKFSDIADMYQSTPYLSEGIFETSIELFYRAEENIRNYMLKMLENIDFKYNEELESILQDFITKSVDFDMRGQILGAPNTVTEKNQKLSEFVSQNISDESIDWIGQFQNNELKGNIMLPYILFFYNIQEQRDILKKYFDYLKKIDTYEDK